MCTLACQVIPRLRINEKHKAMHYATRGLACQNTFPPVGPFASFDYTSQAIGVIPDYYDRPIRCCRGHPYPLRTVFSRTDGLGSS